MEIDGARPIILLTGLPEPDAIDRRQIAGTLGPCGSCANPVRTVARPPDDPETIFYCAACVIRKDHLYIYGELNTETWEWDPYAKPREINRPPVGPARKTETFRPARITWEEYWDEIRAIQSRKGLASYAPRKRGGKRRRAASPESEGFFPPERPGD